MRSFFVGLPNPNYKIEVGDSEEEDYFIDTRKKQQKTTQQSQPKQLKVYQSALAETDEIIDNSKGKEYLFEGFELVEDVTIGQRGFNRNVDRLANILIGHYQQRYPKMYEVTRMQLELREKK